MKKKLLSLAFAAALLPAFNASADVDPGLTIVWQTPVSNELIGNWGKGANPRFATAHDGKIYTVNQTTKSIAEITVAGTLEDKYKLPDIGENYYGTAISVDEAGNFLVGEQFVLTESAYMWTVYDPKTDKAKQFDLGVPAGWSVGRTDCVGRVLGDLTKEALVFIAPQNNKCTTDGTCTPEVRVVKFTGDGTVDGIEWEDLGSATVPAPLAGISQNIAQPGFNTYAEYEAAGEQNYNFYYSGCNGANKSYSAYIDGKTVDNFAPDMIYSISSGLNGFTTFALNGKRYFVRNYSKVAAMFEMGLAVTDEKGDILAVYHNPDYVTNGGYSSLIAEPLSNGTANIYIYNCGNTSGAAVMLSFDPEQCGDPIVPEKPVGGTPDEPYVISTPDDLMNMASKISSADFYAELANDIDMAGYIYSPISTSSTIHFDGKNHVVKNIYTFDPKWDNWGMFKAVKGEFRNLGIENSYNYVGSGCAGALMGEANGDVTIDNCYATGYVYAAAGGGFIGTVVAGTTTITNSYSLVDVYGPANSYVGGLVGRVGSYNGNPGNLDISYCYNGGSISGGVAGGLTSANVVTSVVKIDNVISWGCILNGATVESLCAGVECELGDNFYIFSGLAINETLDGDMSQADLMNVIAEWPAFNNPINNGRAALAWQVANGSNEIPARIGSKDNPYKMYTGSDIAAMRNHLFVCDNYITVEEDIDMTDVPYVAPLGNNNFSGVIVHLDGKQHVISNLSVSAGDYPSLIGVFMGEMKDLGLVNVDIQGGGVGPFGGFIGHATYDGVTTIDNCFATGKVVGTNYAGGFGGYTNGKTQISNSYTRVNVSGSAYAGGMVAWVPQGELKIANTYMAGLVEATGDTGVAGGVVGVMGKDENCTFENVVAWSKGGIYSIADGNAHFVNGGEFVAPEGSIIMCEGFNLNDEVFAEGTKTDAELQALVSSWEAFSDKLDGIYPVLKWQAEGSAGIDDIVADEAEANGPAVYYNLQGVQVANPESGIYIVRRGNKVTKELIR